MSLQISDPILAPFKINVEDSSYTVIEELVISNTSKSTRVGEIRISTTGYYSNLSSALLRIALKKTNMELTDKVTLDQYLSKYKEIVESLKNITI